MNKDHAGMNNNENIAVIFDMDGVIVESNPHHKISWKLFCKKYGKNFSDKDMETHMYGRVNEDILSFIFGRKLSKEELERYEAEKELLYQQSHAPTLEPVTGLISFLNTLNENNIKRAIATSAPTMNVDFVVNKLNLRDLFTKIVDITHVTKGKPDPETYLKAAEFLSIDPKNCLVFEDSFSGIQAAKNAGMKVIGVLTTHTKEEFEGLVDYTISDFTEIEVNQVISLIK